MDELETTILCEAWASILEHFNAMSPTTLDLNNAITLLEYLKEYVTSLRDQFD